MNLTTAQQARLDDVKLANTAYWEAKEGAKERARIRQEVELAEASKARDLKVRLAYEAGVPKLRIGREGMGTSAPVTVEDSLARTAATTPEGSGSRVREGHYEWDNDRKLVRLRDGALRGLEWNIDDVLPGRRTERVTMKEEDAG